MRYLYDRGLRSGGCERGGWAGGAWLIAAILATACSGDVAFTDAKRPVLGPDGLPAAGATAGASGNGAGNGGTDPHLGAEFEPAPAALRRLTVSQYESSVRTLLGDVELTVELEPDTMQDGFTEIAAARVTISPSALEKYETAAYELAAQVITPERRETFVGCVPETVTDATCTRTFLERFGKRAFRRPLTSDEITRYLDVAEQAATTLSDFYAGIEFAIAALLQAPDFLFRVEIGEPDPEDATRLRYTAYEMASRLSFLFWNSMPDDALLDAAEAGDLLTVAGLESEVTRIMEDPRTRAAMSNFHAERLNIQRLDSLGKDPVAFPRMTPDLGAAMREDITRTLDYLTFETGGDYRDAFDTRVAFVDAALAELYGVPGPATGIARVELPEDGLRVGLLGKAGLLANNAHVAQTSPTRRGKFVRELLLCQIIQPPPPDVSTAVPEAPLPDAPTKREWLETHRTEPRCAGCHTLMDPIGLALENFDAIGAYRATDNGHALDVSGELDGAAFADPKELATLLRDQPSTSDCVVRQLYRYATAHLESDGELPAIDALSQAFVDSGYAFPELLRAVVTSEGFRYAAIAGNATEEMP